MENFDVVIVGSGYGGSIAATRFAQAGLRVLILERGPRWSTQDLKQSDDPRYLSKVVDLVITNAGFAFRTGCMVGGASVPMDGAHFRAPQKTFEVRDDDGRPYWPSGFSRSALDPYYARVESIMKIRQFGWNEIPKAGGLFAKMLDLSGVSCERSRLNYTDCNHCGYCAQGCTFDKKMTMLHTYLPLAEASGAEVRPGCLVDHLEPDGTGYVVHYTKDVVKTEVRGARVVVACGGVHSPALMLRSKKYLPKLSAQVGENFNNNGEHGVIGILPPEFDDLSKYACYMGSENAAMMTFHYFESEGFTLHPGGGLEPSILASSLSASDHPLVPKRAWGMEYKRFVEAIYPNRLIAFSTLGLADGHRAITLDFKGAPNVTERDRTTYDAYLDRVERLLGDISKKSGVALLPVVSRKQSGTTSTHLLSSCRMAEDATHGVVDANCEVFGHENLYICDASSVPYALGVNPALTISAVTERAVEHAIAKG